MEKAEVSPVSRRTLMKAAVGAAAASVIQVPAPDANAQGNAAAPPIAAPPDPTGAGLRWLGETPPEPAACPGVTWGVPWPRGVFPAGQTFSVRTAVGEAVPVQTWPLAYWPDGSLKWTAHALGVPAKKRGSESLHLAPGEAAAPSHPITTRETGDAIEIDTGIIRCRVPRKGDVLFESVQRKEHAIVERAQLVCLRRSTPDFGPEDEGALRQEKFTGRVTGVTLEQTGPVRVVVKLEGKHQGAGRRAWLPFTIRLYFYAGSEAVRIVHSFVFDGDENKDFLSGLGVRFSVPMRDPLHDRHVRFAGEGNGLWAEAVRGLTGLRRDPGREAREAQLAGRATPPQAELPEAVRSRLDLIPAWGDYTLSQLTADGFQIRKRTKPGHGWIHAASGRQASGLGYIGGATGGGVAFGLRDFWQRHPTQLDIRDATTDRAEVTVWLWAPDAPAMDLRFFHDGMGMNTHAEELQGLEITYEDYEKGWGTPHGVARTSELTLWACEATPAREHLVALAESVRNPALLVCTPEHAHKAGVFGSWSLPDRTTPAKEQIEGQLDYLTVLYQKQIEQRRWYGFWDYGDVIHSYDRDRHEWCYDVGGFAWANSELSPDLWLWYSYLRSGRADIFRMAEAMTRHTSEVDVHHIGRFAGFGSRHNVQHWGDSSKQPRVSTAAYRRFYYYLTADERTGDLLRALLGSDQQLREIKIGRKVGGRSTANPDSGDHAPDPVPAYASFGTDWSSFAAAWLTEWERTGDARWRDRILVGMKDIGAMPRGWFAAGAGYDPDTGHFLGRGDTISISHLNAVFGAVEINAELLQLLDVPEYERAWLEYCELYNAPAEEKEKRLGWRGRPLNLGEAHSRLTAYAARRKNDKALAERAWREFYSGAAGIGVRNDRVLRRFEGPAVLNPVEEGFGMSTNATSQWSLAAIQNLALIGEWLPDTPPVQEAPRRRESEEG